MFCSVLFAIGQFSTCKRTSVPHNTVGCYAKLILFIYSYVIVMACLLACCITEKEVLRDSLVQFWLVIQGVLGSSRTGSSGFFAGVSFGKTLPNPSLVFIIWLVAEIWLKYCCKRRKTPLNQLSITETTLGPFFQIMSHTYHIGASYHFGDERWKMEIVAAA